MSTNLSLIIKLWQALDNLQLKDNPTIYMLAETFPELEEALSAIASTKPENFDLEVKIVDEEDGKDLFTIPSSRRTSISITANYEKLTIEIFKQIVLYNQKVSDWLIDNCNFNIDKKKIVPFLDNGIEDSWNILKQRIGYTKTSLVDIKEPQEALNEDHIVWCYNNSCTGKTWLAVQLLDKYSGVKKIAFNTSSTQLIDSNLLLFLLEYGCNCCFLIDDLQGDVELATDIVRYLCLHKRSLKNRNVFVILVSWNNLHATQHIKEIINRNHIYCFQTKPERNKIFLETQVRGISENLLSVCGDNLCLLSKAVMLTSSKNKMSGSKLSSTLSISDFQKLLFDDFVQTTDIMQLKLAYICSVLGTYEYETPISFLEQYGIIENSTLPVAKFANGTIFVGHKDICNFIFKYIETYYEMDISPQEIIIDYINFIDGTLKWKALLHFGHNKKSDVFGFGFIWNLLNDLMDSLRKASVTDPTFSNTPSSMCFILLVANFFREVDDFKAVADSFANCFSIIDGHISIDFEKCRTTQDFEKIKEHMILEDASTDTNPRNYVSGFELDEVQMHTNWLLSLLVQVGSIMRHFGYVDLISFAEQDLINNQTSDGSWYPNRVPWITACALRGLSKVETLNGSGKWVKKYNKNSEPIKNAINYLINNMHSDGYWDAHTGGWNKICETSSMCLDALHKFGIKCDSIVETSLALDYLKNHTSEWMDEGNEIDGAATACCLMDALGVEQSLLDYIQELTKRNITSIFSLPSEEELRDQSCKAALITYYVTELCWNIIEREIDLLMDDFLADSLGNISNPIMISETTIVVNNPKFYGPAQINEGIGTMYVNNPKSIN